VAEVLALRCGGGVAARADLYESLATDLAAVVAVDARMRLDAIAEPNVWPYLYRFNPELAYPPILFTLPAGLEAGRTVLDGMSCAHKLTVALHGTAVERADADSPFIEIDFPGRLDAARLRAAYAGIGVPLEILSRDVSDGARASLRDIPGGREYLLELRGGDCPAGCTFSRSFWWRVADGKAELVGEFGMSLESDGAPTPAPIGFDPTSFDCTVPP